MTEKSGTEKLIDSLDPSKNPAGVRRLFGSVIKKKVKTKLEKTLSNLNKTSGEARSTAIRQVVSAFSPSYADVISGMTYKPTVPDYLLKDVLTLRRLGYQDADIATYLKTTNILGSPSGLK